MQSEEGRETEKEREGEREKEREKNEIISQNHRIGNNDDKRKR